MDLQGRIVRLQDAAEDGTLIEQELLHDVIIDVSKNGTANAGSMDTWVVTLETGRREAIFKRLGNVNSATALIYKQDRIDANVHEVVAWRLAYAMGDPWEQLLPTVVLRTLEDHGPGVLCNRREGRPDREVFNRAAGQAAAAAFWDSLVGQQDRHAGQYRYDEKANRLALIDHAFCFARPGDYCHESVFLRRRRAQHHDRLNEHEAEVLEGLIGSDMYGLRMFLPEDRADALYARANKMFDTNRLLLPGDY
jgi:hypothetical protein